MYHRQHWVPPPPPPSPPPLPPLGYGCEWTYSAQMEMFHLWKIWEHDRSMWTHDVHYVTYWKQLWVCQHLRNSLFHAWSTSPTSRWAWQWQSVELTPSIQLVRQSCFLHIHVWCWPMQLGGSQGTETSWVLSPWGWGETWVSRRGTAAVNDHGWYGRLGQEYTDSE